ncbi:MAG: garD, partial [Pseudomonas sp.]|nr:garD [Pseudomonas sp.]
MNLIQHADSPRYIQLNELDNVVVVVNDQGVPAGTKFDNGLVTLDNVPQSHKVNLVDIAEGAPVIRYGQTIGYALQAIPRGSWVREDQLRMPTAPPLDSLP